MGGGPVELIGLFLWLAYVVAACAWLWRAGRATTPEQRQADLLTVIALIAVWWLIMLRCGHSESRRTAVLGT